MNNVTLLCGDALSMLRMLPDGVADTCVTSPPYFGLRSYLNADDPNKPLEVGTEQTPLEFVSRLVEVFREVRRVLKDDGCIFVNMGDSYAGNGAAGIALPGATSQRANRANVTEQRTSGRVEGLPAKSLLGIPWRLAFALQDDGWILRQDIIWSKPNPMPESVTDRCTKSHEYIFLLSKRERYHFDADAIAEPCTDSSCSRLSQNVAAQVGSARANGGTKTNGNMKAVGGETRNRRSVWTVSTQPYSGAHFATFPPELIRPCILAGSRLDGTVLDPFNGSGTTGAVSLEEGRNYIGIDLNPAYLDLTRKRIAGVTPPLFARSSVGSVKDVAMIEPDAQGAMPL